MTAELEKGTLVDGRYELKEFKGSGSFGEVWLAHDKELGVDVAIKLYILLDSKGQQEFKEEYKVAYGLNHENLLAATYYSVWQNRPYLIMKYCGNGSANNYSGAIQDELQIWQFIHDVAAGLKFLHSLEPAVVHQDIKPENILVDDNGTFLISDFGISRKLRSTLRKQSKRAPQAGAIAYMGPERFLEEPLVVLTSDIWALGVSIYELINGDLPFGGQGGGMLNSGAQLPKLNTQKWSENLNKVMRACLAKETWDRPTAAKLADYAQHVIDMKKDNKEAEIIDWDKWTGKVSERIVIKRKWLLPTIISTIAVAAIAIGVFLAIKPDPMEELVKRNYARNTSLCENGINMGDNVNYNALLVAKEKLDSLVAIEKDYPEIVKNLPINKTSQLRNQLTAKCNSAHDAWIRSAEGQYTVAEDMAEAIKRYYIAYSLKKSSDVKSGIDKIAIDKGLTAAYMNITDTEIKDSNLRIVYNGINDQNIEDVVIGYKLTPISGDASNIIESQSNFTLRTGENRGVSIDLSPAPTEAQYMLELYQNGHVFYRGRINN